MDDIKDVIKDVIGKIANKEPQSTNNLIKIFEEALNEKERKHCCVSGYKDGILMVNVESSMWLYQIKTQYMKILKKIKEKIPDIKSIKFRIGKIT